MTTTTLIHDVTAFSIEQKEMVSGGKPFTYQVITIYVNGAYYGDVTLFEKAKDDDDVRTGE